MERFCCVLRLRAGCEAEFDQRHREIWPEMIEGMRSAGFANYSLFRRGTSVVSYSECHPDRATCLSTFSASPVAARWGESMDALIEDMIDQDGQLYAYDQIWHLA
jgi:L-rhamnose mutarotase